MNGKRRAGDGASQGARLDDAFRLETAGSLEAADALYRRVAEEAEDPRQRARALLRRAHVHRSWGVWVEAVRLAQSGRALARQVGDGALEGELLNAEGAVHQARGEHEEARRLFRGILGITDDPRVRGIALQNLGAISAAEKRFGEAEPYFRESAECFREAGYPRGEAMAAANRGRVLVDQGRAADAIPALDAAAAAAVRVGDLELHALVMLNLAEAQLDVGSVEEAAENLTQAIGYFTAEENPWRVVECLRLQGDLAHRAEDADEAERCWTKGLDLARALEAGPEVELLERRLARLRAR